MHAANTGRGNRHVAAILIAEQLWCVVCCILYSKNSSDFVLYPKAYVVVQGVCALESWTELRFLTIIGHQACISQVQYILKHCSSLCVRASLLMPYSNREINVHRCWITTVIVLMQSLWLGMMGKDVVLCRMKKWQWWMKPLQNGTHWDFDIFISICPLLKDIKHQESCCWV